jgi:hypothetical protein
MYTFSLITLEDLEKIKYSSEFPGNQAAWITNWYSTFKNQDDNDFGIGKKPYIVTAYKENALVAIVPLMKLTRTYFKVFKLQFLEFLGQQWSGMGYDIIRIRKLEDCFARELVYWLKRNISFHYLFLKYLPTSSKLKSNFHFFRYAGALFIKPSDFNVYEDFALEVYPRKFREDLRRTLRRVKKDGFEMTVEQCEINEKTLKTIRSISASKTTDGKSNLYADRLKEGFHLNMYRQHQSKVIFIKFNGKAVAYGTTIDFNGKRIGVDAAFDRNYRRYGVGVHCIDQIIRASFKDGVQVLSFGLGMDAYKFQFANCIEEFFMCYDFKFRLKSLLVLPYFKYRLLKTNKEIQAVIDGLSAIKKPIKIETKPKKREIIVLSAEKKLQHSS